MNTPAGRSHWAVHVTMSTLVAGPGSVVAGEGLWYWAHGLVLPEPTKLGQLLKSASKERGKPGGRCTKLLWSTLTRQNVSPCLHFSLACNSGVIVSHFPVRYTRLTSNALFKEAGNPLSQKQFVTLWTNIHRDKFFSFLFPLFLFYSSLSRSTADSAIYKSVPLKGIRFIFAKWMCGFYYAWQVWLESK